MDCASIIPDVNYGSFSRKLQSAIVQARIPAGGSIDLTSRCNLNCIHCYVKSNPREPELTLPELDRLLDEIAVAGCLWLLMTGGEPLLRPDFAEVYLLAKKKGFLINLFTNAVLVTERTAGLLAEWRPFAIEVTLYGATKETYEQVTRTPGSFERCMNGIKLIRENGLPLRFKTMLLNVNRDELNQMMALAESLGCEFRYDSNIHGHLDGTKDSCEYRLTPEEIVALDREDPRRISALREYIDYSSQFHRAENRIFHCGAGLNSFHIDSLGRLSPCMLARRDSYDLRHGNFPAGWDLLRRIREREAGANTKCARCHLYELCGQCPGWGEIENGDAEAPSEFLCQLAHVREAAYGAELFAETPGKNIDKRLRRR
ncbi:MAG: radical SAM protein [Thermoleophilia bacterium]